MLSVLHRQNISQIVKQYDDHPDIRVFWETLVAFLDERLVKGKLFATEADISTILESWPKFVQDRGVTISDPHCHALRVYPHTPDQMLIGTLEEEGVGYNICATIKKLVYPESADDLWEPPR